MSERKTFKKTFLSLTIRTKNKVSKTTLLTFPKETVTREFPLSIQSCAILGLHWNLK